MEAVIELGYPLEKLPFAAWAGAVEKYGDPVRNPLHPLLPFLHLNIAARMFGVSDAAYHALGTQATQQALAASGIHCPPVNHALIRTYLQRFVEAGRLEHASAYARV